MNDKMLHQKSICDEATVFSLILNGNVETGHWTGQVHPSHIYQPRL